MTRELGRGRPWMGRSPAPKGTRLGRTQGAKSRNFRQHTVTKEEKCGDIHNIGDTPVLLLAYVWGGMLR